MLSKALGAPMEALRRRLRGVRADRRGAIAPAAALVMLPMTLLVFGAVEFSRYTAVRKTVQDGIDAASLAVARSASEDPAELQRVGEAVLRAQVPFGTNLQLASYTVSIVNGRIISDARVTVSPIISDMLFSGSLTVSGHSEVLREVWGLEVALVLDTTGSMATNNRIGIAKTAAENFITTLERVAATSSNPAAVKYGLVPFAATVNVGTANATAPWMDANALSPAHSRYFYTNRGVALPLNRFTLLTGMGIAWGGCVESRPMPYDIQDTGAAATTPATLFVPYFAPDEMDYVPSTRAANPYLPDYPVQPQPYPNSYLPDLFAAVASVDPATGQVRDVWPDFNIYGHADPMLAFMQHVGGPRGAWGGPATIMGVNSKYTSAKVDAEVAAGRFSRTSTTKGPNRGCTMQPVTRLTDNGASVITAIQAMTIGGSTNIPMGLMWGWHLLSPNTPFADGQAYATRGNTKIIVLMTDGANSLQHAAGVNGSDYSAVGFAAEGRFGNTAVDAASVTTALNNRLAALCTNVKAAGVVLYTVRLEMTGDNSLLQTCATDAAKAFDVNNAAALDETFQKIARSIQNLRVAR